MVGATRSLLHVVSHDNDGVVLFQLGDQFLSLIHIYYPGQAQIQGARQIDMTDHRSHARRR